MVSVAQELVIRKIVLRVKDIAVTDLGPLASLNDTINGEFQAIVRDIENYFIYEPFDLAEVAGLIQGLIQTPYLASSDIESRFSIYRNFVTNILELVPASGVNATVKNQTIVIEAASIAATIAIAQIMTTGKLRTRKQALQIADTIVTDFGLLTGFFDNIQNRFESAPVNLQYVSQIISRPDLSTLTGLTLRYLLLLSFNLQVERTIVLDRPRTPIEIAITEYGTLGNSDENLDKLIETNELSGDDLIWLAAGREIVIYG